MNSILIAMSGGVDSSVAAQLLLNQGYDLQGGIMILHQNPACGSSDDVEDARAIAARLEIPFHVFDLQEEFSRCVIGKFIEAYQNGATPNPCIECNRHLKFSALLDRADKLGISHLATGHYARIERAENGRYLLKKAADLTKDQSYVLYRMTQKELSRTLFPLGAMTKTQVRELAESNGFLNAKKRDSQDICFVPDGDYAGFIERTTGETYPEGEFVDLSGNVLGTHKGIIHYTVGQRKGLGLALPQPMYVCRKELAENRVVLGLNRDLFSSVLTADDLNWISVDPPEAPIRVKARIRYKQPEQWATVQMTDADTVRVEFDEPQRAIARGQAVVFYDGDTVVGGGTIK
ncbi:MAG: tRNA 2-thiouridine(34) synthase MnmA [Oscillospiraceae bacterium]|nr:tRNA 2-thiouridine(34) synthase MnmA [Oscillospiraceae bacterium]